MQRTARLGVSLVLLGLLSACGTVSGGIIGAGVGGVAGAAIAGPGGIIPGVVVGGAAGAASGLLTD